MENTIALLKALTKPKIDMSTKILMVGISEYQNPENNLRGPNNDLIDMIETTSLLGIKRRCVIANKHATKDNILSHLNAMIETTKAGEHVIFYFSGHGGQIPDKDSDENDKLDEILVTYDYPDSYISDDDLYKIITKLNPAATIDVILDCCHSGTGTRSIQKKQKERFVKNNNVVGKVYSQFNFFTWKAQQVNLDRKIQHTLWSACRASETAKEVPMRVGLFHKEYRGVFTYYFCKHLRKHNRKITRQRFAHTLRIPKKYNQHHQVEYDLVVRERMMFK